MTGNIPVDTEDDVAQLACEAMFVDLQDELPEGEEVRLRRGGAGCGTFLRLTPCHAVLQELVDAEVVEYIPKTWRENMSASVSQEAHRSRGIAWTQL